MHDLEDMYKKHALFLEYTNLVDEVKLTESVSC